jgi:hypothetical protein
MLFAMISTVPVSWEALQPFLTPAAIIAAVVAGSRMKSDFDGMRLRIERLEAQNNRTAERLDYLSAQLSSMSTTLGRIDERVSAALERR